MLSVTKSFFFFICIIAVCNASIRGQNNRLREQTDLEAASYNNILSNLDESTMQKIHQRFLMEKTAEREDVRELQEVEGSLSLSMSLSVDRVPPPPKKKISNKKNGSNARL
ncbi:hypothetical protein IV203_019226 [Nitzschia inconspicua]|uniref:Uncharacterized protein n=1 Tax=Nitzschia inconspicua TaxID=303405 RepID=A0A9K3M0K6_9STRA|nr:hypothetical protein IV203_019226 [Nitzschia inconspicua]